MEGSLISYEIGESQEIGDTGPLLYIKREPRVSNWGVPIFIDTRSQALMHLRSYRRTAG